MRPLEFCLYVRYFEVHKMEWIWAKKHPIFSFHPMLSSGFSAAAEFLICLKFQMAEHWNMKWTNCVSPLSSLALCISPLSCLEVVPSLPKRRTVFKSKKSGLAACQHCSKDLDQRYVSGQSYFVGCVSKNVGQRFANTCVSPYIHTYITICIARCVDSTEYMSNQNLGKIGANFHLAFVDPV